MGDVTFDCGSIVIDSRNASLVTVTASDCEIDEIVASVGVKQFVDNSSVDEVLDEIGEDAVIAWLDSVGYEVVNK
ncbi:MAG: hypothetical protein ACRDCI_00150 [Plesiomonas shigelloides]